MEIDILGKVKEKKLAYSNTLLPLFEAIVNSIHAIEEGCSTKPGIITVTLVRSNEQQSFDFIEGNPLPPIMDFVIRDNGIGFTEANFESFNFAHSTYKIKKGGKGIGRITWLRAFQKAEIESIYKNNDQLLHRRFNFEPTKKGIEGHNLVELKESNERFTEVRLRNLKEDYRRWCNSRSEDIALRIIEHCFAYFLDEGCPRIKIIDGNEQIIVNDYFRKFTKNETTEKTVQIRDFKFTVNIVRVYGDKADNKIHYCANTREVVNEKISMAIAELDSFILDENSEAYTIGVYVFGQYLDEHVNEERTDISFYRGSANFPDEVSQDELRSRVAEVIKEEFSGIIDGLAEIRLKKIKEFVQSHPRYRYLLKYKRDDVRKISSSLSDDKLEIELFKVNQKLEVELLTETKEILSSLDSVADKDHFAEKHKDLYNKIIEVGNSKLSEYVLHRKLILDLLEKHLKKNASDNYAKEDAIHKLIFPIKTLSDDIAFEDHNLWIIDERLAFHKYLASDKSLKQIELIESDSINRPDIIVFNRPFAFSEDKKPYSSVVIIEFKRPMRNDYTEEENPISQINKYCREILSSGGKDKDGRLLDIKQGTPIYAYIICDLTSNLRQFAEDQSFTSFPDNDGYFNFNKNYGLYIEIISFDKLLKDSKQKNKVLFEKLSLPTS
jgi:hypothetical protein